MLILSITTSSNNCSVAVMQDSICLKELNISNAKTHSENLMPLVDTILKETNLTLSSFDYLACDIGPGSFTGIRIGIATVKAISQIINIPICPVSSLEGLSAICESSCDTICSLIDARNDQVYCGIFNKDFSKKCEYMADSISNVINKLKDIQNITFVGDGADIHKSLLQDNFSNSSFIDNASLSAKYIAKIANLKIHSDQVCSADELLPLYLRKSQAERMAEQRNG